MPLGNRLSTVSGYPAPDTLSPVAQVMINLMPKRFAGCGLIGSLRDGA
jgi:hypothetical protein